MWTNSKLSTFQFDGADLSFARFDAAIFNLVTLFDSVLAENTFIGATFTNLIMEDVVLSDADFSGATFAGVAVFKEPPPPPPARRAPT